MSDPETAGEDDALTQALAARARAIELDTLGRRTLKAILDDSRMLFELAIGRRWKGKSHPDFIGASKALQLEAQLSGYMAKEGKPADEPVDDATFEAHMQKLGYVKRQANGNGKRPS
jgi:hypothetical protein